MKDCEYLNLSFGCKARDSVKELMLLELMESKELVEMCKEQCCDGCILERMVHDEQTGKKKTGCKR